jgi:Kef-type K+ transport system membrane component KefB
VLTASVGALPANLLAVQRTADDILLLVFGGIAVILAVARLVGWIFGRLGQPAVVGEVVGGVLLGPSVLGLLPGDPSALLFPADIQPYLRVIATFGLIIYMFVIGLELDPRVVANERRAAVSVSLAGVASPFVLGAFVALFIHGSHDTAVPLGASEPVDVELLGFALFCGLAIAGSAFAILARILDERNLLRTRIGGVLLASTVVDDVTVWMLAAVVLTIAAAGSLLAVPLTLGGLGLFVVVLFFVVRPLLARFMRDRPSLSPDLFAILLLGLLGSALYTTWLGISPILGAFFFGAAVPREGTAKLFTEVNTRLESLSVLVLLPVFFAVTGRAVDLSSIGWDGAALLAVFVVVATGGKMIGALIGGSLNGIRGRRAMAMGVLMNTRGLSELAIITIGRNLGLLDTTMFTVLICTAITTTLISGPLLRFVYPKHLIDADIAATERSRLAATSAYRVLVLVDDVAESRPAVDLAVDIARSEPSAEVVLSRIAVSATRSELGSGFLGELGAMTSAMDELRSLSAEVADRGVVAVPQSVLARDLAAELAAQVERLRPHLVVLPRGAHAEGDTGDGTGADADEIDRLAIALSTTSAVDVAVVRAPHGGGAAVDVVRIGSGREPHQALAAEVGARLAVARHASVELDGRRSGAVADLLDALEVSVIEADGVVPAVTIAPAGSPNSVSGGSMITVHAYESPAGPRQLGRLAERLRAGDPASS